MSNPATETNKKKMYYWISVIILFVINLVIGTLGYQRYFELHSQSLDLARAFYRTIQLFTLEGGDFVTPIPCLLNVVRFTAPVVTIGAVILALWEVIAKQWKRWRISRMKNHVVVIGLGTKGKNIMEETLVKDKKAKVLVVEKDPLNPHLASLKSRRCRHIFGNASNIDILKKARIIHAKQVHLMMGDDSQQVQTCVLIYDIIQEMKRDKADPLECNMHLLKHEYLDILRKHRLVQSNNDGLSLNVFNLYVNSARELFQEHSPDGSGISETSNKYVQLIIFGFGQAGEALALQCALTGHYLNRKTKLPQVVIFDRDAQKKVDEFKKRYPTYTDYCDLSLEMIEANSPQLIPELEKYLIDPEALNTIVLCFDNKINNLMLGLQIDSLSPSAPSLPFQVFIRTDDNESNDAISRNLKPYGLPSSVCSLNAITGCDLDVQAKAVHADFLKSRKKHASSFGSQPSDVEWNELPQEFKDSSRKAADHIGVKIRGIGCHIKPEDDPRTATIITPSELELLAELEHYRWNAERSLAGWTYAKVKNNKNRKTPYLVDWANLPKKIQQYDRDAVANIPNVLKEAGLKIVR